MRMRKLTSAVNWRKVIGFVGLFTTLVMNIGLAQAQLDAYSIQVAVADRSDAELQNANLIGMRSVLLANSGDKTLLNRDDVRAGLDQAANYVASFRYNTPAPGTVIPPRTPLTDSVRSSGEATQLILIQFNRELINQLIQSGADVQSESEPESEPDSEEVIDPFTNVTSALMWLIVEDGGNQMLISAANGQNVMERAREIAGGSGLSLSFPAGDNTDVQAVGIDDIKTSAIDAVNAAAERYAQPLTLAAHLSRTRTGSWEAVWFKVANDGQQQNQASTSRNLDEALQKGIAWLNSESLESVPVQDSFQTSLRANTSSTEGLVWVSPLRTTQNYAQVMAFLTSLDGVSVAYPKEVLDNGVVFAIVPRSALPAISSAAGSADWLRQSATPTSAGESQYANAIAVAFEYLR